MKILRFITCFAVLLVFAGVCQARKMSPMNIEKGETPDDTNDKVNVSLTEENVAKGCAYGLSVKFTGAGWAGQFNPKKAAWSAFKKADFCVFSSADKPRKMTFVIKDEKGGDGRKEWAVIPFDVKPGMNEISLPIEGVKAQSGRGLNLGKVTQWHFSYKFFPENAWEEKGDDNFDAVISNFRLED